MQNATSKLIYRDADPNLHSNVTKLQPPFVPPLPGSVWRVGISPWAKLRPECLNQSLKCEAGVELEVLVILATLLNATFEFVTLQNQTGCGYKTADGSWTGLMSMLSSGQIDITGNLCTVDEWRRDANFTKSSSPVVRYRQGFLIKLPELSFVFSILAPFDSPLWFTLFGSMFLYSILDAYLKKLFWDIKMTGSFKESLIGILQQVSAMDVKVEHNKRMWFVLTCYISFFSMLYTTCVKGALITPVTVERPFIDTIDLADKLFTGEYKFVDYHEKPNIAYPRCYLNICDKIKKAINTYGYHFTRLSETPDGTDKLLAEILNKDNLVFAKGRYWLDTYLDNFKGRSDLWVMEDELAGEEWSAYFFRKDFELAEHFDRALTLLGDFKMNIHNRYLGLSKMAYDKKFVKGDIPEKSVMKAGDMQGPITCYFIGIAVSVVIFFVEVFVRNQTTTFNLINRTRLA